jgi:16S rRNA (guanine527-N7)-methyltransferase
MSDPPNRSADLGPLLAAGAAALQIELGVEQQAQLLRYLALLGRWNKTYNLSSIRDPADMVTRHLLDCLAVLPYLAGDRLLDVGTGAGLPGMVLAIADPRRDWVLIDSNGKKVRFLNQARMELRLANVEIVWRRVEDYHPDTAFDTVVSRAVGNLAALYTITAHLRRSPNWILAMKGVLPEAELAELAPFGLQTDVHRLSVPGLAAARHLVVVKSKS